MYYVVTSIEWAGGDGFAQHPLNTSSLQQCYWRKNQDAPTGTENWLTLLYTPQIHSAPGQCIFVHWTNRNPGTGSSVPGAAGCLSTAHRLWMLLRSVSAGVCVCSLATGLEELTEINLLVCTNIAYKCCNSLFAVRCCRWTTTTTARPSIHPVHQSGSSYPQMGFQIFARSFVLSHSPSFLFRKCLNLCTNTEEPW